MTPKKLSSLKSQNKIFKNGLCDHHSFSQIRISKIVTKIAIATNITIFNLCLKAMIDKNENLQVVLINFDHFVIITMIILQFSSTVLFIVWLS